MLASTKGALLDYVKYVYASAWKDRLVRLEKYDSNSTLVETINVSHNSIGNMTSNGERTYEWQAGRQLKQFTINLTEDECRACAPGTDGGDMRLLIEFSGNNVLNASGSSVTATAKVMFGTADVTGTIPAAKFSWTRDNDNATSDAAWNSTHTGMKSV